MAIDYREPLLFAQGDSLIFQRSLPDYLPSNGWSLLYEIRSSDQSTIPAIQFTSTPDATNTLHEINVLPAVTALWLPGENVLVGYVVNVSGERHQIYYAALEIVANLGTTANTVDVTTHAQRMIPLIEAALEKLAIHSMNETNIQHVQILREKRMDLEKQLGYNKEIRANEIAQENIRNGRPGGNSIKPQFNIINTGSCGFGTGWPFLPRT